MESIGQRLKAARERKRISLSQAALKTHTKVQILEALERDDFGKIAAPTYTKGFIKLYASFLGLEAAPLVQEYIEYHGGGAKRPPLPADVALAKPAPGDVPVPIPAERSSAEDATGNGSPAAGFRWPAVNPQALAAALAIIAVLLVIIGAIKFWPTSSSDAPPASGARIVEVQRPVQRSPLAVMHEPPEPYIEIQPQNPRAP